MLMPFLLSLAGKTVPTVATAAQLNAAVGKALAAAEGAGYQVEALAGTGRGSSRAAGEDLASKPTEIKDASPSERA